MLEELSKKSEFREYLLGNINLEEEKTKIEEKLMLGDDYFQDLLIEEEELIQDYVDQNLTPAEIQKFEEKFLKSAELRSKVQFARSLRKYISGQPRPKKFLDIEKEKKNSFFFTLKNLFRQPLPIVATILAVAALSIFLVWKFSANSANDSKFIASLNKAYSKERPLESRITDLNYAPPAPTTRGGAKDDSKVDKNELKRAENMARDAVSEKPSADSFHELGRFYLSEKNFDEAINQFESAIKLSADNAKLHNDLGVALTEKSKVGESKDNLNSLNLPAKAIEEFEIAIKINKNLAEAYFNKAICLQLMGLTNQAGEAWREYLKLDQTSPWANEARQKLEKLESLKSKDYPSEEFEQVFLTAFLQKDDEKAWQMISGNRELIKKKYLPQKLAMSFVEASESERSKILQALIYVGELEKKRSNDPFAVEIATFYKTLAPSHFEKLKQAQNLVSHGYKLSLNGEFSHALDEFKQAQIFFCKQEMFGKPIYVITRLPIASIT